MNIIHSYCLYLYSILTHYVLANIGTSFSFYSKQSGLSNSKSDVTCSDFILLWTIYYTIFSFKKILCVHKLLLCWFSFHPLDQSILYYNDVTLLNPYSIKIGSWIRLRFQECKSDAWYESISCVSSSGTFVSLHNMC